ncbi:hypothetical protein FACS1894132_08420 [Clostridia bacterium]|nr:hypothetical protein FACS1894132_08420 [Clostridia bacterium]
MNEEKYYDLTVEGIRQLRTDRYNRHKEELNKGNSQPFYDEIKEGANRAYKILEEIRAEQLAR